jgi:signal transduction histidine kinase
LAAALALTVLLIVCAVFGADSVARSDAARSRQVFETSSAEIASTLQLAIQREEDLVVSAAAFWLDNPQASNADFRGWSASVQAMTRFPEMTSWGTVVIVPASELPAFAARTAADPVSPLGPDGILHVSPPGQRPFYCLNTLGEARTAGLVAPPGLDFCVGAQGAAAYALIDSGKNQYSLLNLGAGNLLSVQVPVYRGGVVPATVQARRAAFVGWMGMAFLPKVVLDRALQGHPGTAVSLHYRLNTSDALFSSGPAPAGSESATTDLHDGWTVQTFGAVARGSVLADGSALALLIVGVLLSVLLGVLLFVLATGRSRALQLVAERTAQLRGAQAQLVDAARQAGMAEIATNVLHNVGNVLNGVNVSANLVAQKVRGSKSAGLVKAVALMNEHADDLGGFLTTDPRGKALPDYLDKLATALTAERESVDSDLLRLTKGVAHIKEIVASQQSLAGVSGVIDSVRVSDLVEDALRMAGIGEDEVTVIRDFPTDPLLALDRHRVLLILLNLISNAMHAMKGNGRRPRELSFRVETIDGQGVSITVADSGVGIPPENMTRIFVHGFTTHTDGHGFGLHSSALAATEMGGSLTLHDTPDGIGAAFTLEIPLDRQAVTA